MCTSGALVSFLVCILIRQDIHPSINPSQVIEMPLVVAQDLFSVGATQRREQPLFLLGNKFVVLTLNESFIEKDPDLLGLEDMDRLSFRDMC